MGQSESEEKRERNVRPRGNEDRDIGQKMGLRGKKA